MKAPILVVLTLVMLAGHVDGARAQSGESASEQADKALAVALWQVAAATHTRIGFQSVETISSMSGMYRHPQAATVSSIEDALDSAIAANPRYEWHRAGGGASWFVPQTPGTMRPIHSTALCITFEPNGQTSRTCSTAFRN